MPEQIEDARAGKNLLQALKKSIPMLIHLHLGRVVQSRPHFVSISAIIPADFVYTTSTSTSLLSSTFSFMRKCLTLICLVLSEHITRTTSVTVEQLNALTGVDLAEFSARMKKFIDKQAQYELELRRLYADILQHLSVESTNLLTKDTETFRLCQKKQDPIYLIKVLKKCHSQIGRQVSDEEKRVKRLELESLKVCVLVSSRTMVSI